MLYHVFTSMTVSIKPFPGSVIGDMPQRSVHKFAWIAKIIINLLLTLEVIQYVRITVVFPAAWLSAKSGQFFDGVGHL